ncbi:MAG TPA: hypothetical protein VJQ56_05675 [Blastocatellia bacterium]|nr:hypothetical protein [Blastocatellia bacterium]
MSTVDRDLIHAILQEIDALLRRGVLPVHNDHHKHLREDNILEYLIIMKNQGLISGDLITIGTETRPYRMTNIRLTYAGIRALRA